MGAILTSDYSDWLTINALDYHNVPRLLTPDQNQPQIEVSMEL